MQKDFITIEGLLESDAQALFTLAAKIKQKRKSGQEYKPLEGKVLGMIFEKPSSRTRVSFEAGIYQLGGMGIYLSAADIQLSRGETVSDTAKVLSGYIDGIMIRAKRHSDVKELSEAATIPVINGLTDLYHPCQALSDLFTIKEKFGRLKGLTMAYVGDGCNTCHSLLLGSALLGVNIKVASPEGYKPNDDVVKKAEKLAASQGSTVTVGSDPLLLVRNADVIYTDVWTSMGKEAETKERLKVFSDYQVNAKMLSLAAKDAIVMHCLPAHRGQEITSDVLDGPHSVVFTQAENRLYLQNAIMTILMGE